jgi:hypothetical protein
MRRHPLAFGLSLALHLGLGAIVVMTTARMSADAGPRTIQLNGTRQERQAGRDALFEVLRGDGMPIHLASASGDAAVGLAWWSPAAGLWLATDRLPHALSGRRLQVTLQVGDEAPTRIGPMAIDGDGSGRIVAVWNRARPAPGTPVTLTVSESESMWGWRPPATVLAGAAPMR